MDPASALRSVRDDVEGCDERLARHPGAAQPNPGPMTTTLECTDPSLRCAPARMTRKVDSYETLASAARMRGAPHAFGGVGATSIEVRSVPIP
jgi:hypothetical protein